MITNLAVLAIIVATFLSLRLFAGVPIWMAAVVALTPWAFAFLGAVT